MRCIWYASMYFKIVMQPFYFICNHIQNIFRSIIIYHTFIQRCYLIHSNTFKFNQIQSNTIKFIEIPWMSSKKPLIKNGVWCWYNFWSICKYIDEIWSAINCRFIFFGIYFLSYCFVINVDNWDTNFENMII